MLTWFIGGFHLISALGLIGLVLLHSGKGGGVSDMFGGGVNTTAAGSTLAERNLNRIMLNESPSPINQWPGVKPVPQDKTPSDSQIHSSITVRNVKSLAK